MLGQYYEYPCQIDCSTTELESPIGHDNETDWKNMPIWYHELMQMDWFQTELREKYKELQPYLTNIYQDNYLGKNQIDLLYSSMSGAIAYHRQCWMETGAIEERISPEQKLKTWLQCRNERIFSQLFRT